MMITPASSLAGQRVTETIEEYTRMMAQSREQAIDRMIAEANELGADAILDVRFTTSYVMGGAAEILATGNAVKLEVT